MKMELIKCLDSDEETSTETVTEEKNTKIQSLLEYANQVSLLFLEATYIFLEVL